MHGLMRGKRAKPSNLLYDNHTPLRGEQQATIYYDRRRCEKRLFLGVGNEQYTE